MTVEIGADNFSLIATLPCGCRVNFGRHQTHPRQAGRSRVKGVEMRLSLVHEESQGFSLDKAGRSPTTIMVPAWQHGQRERSTRVIFTSQSLAERMRDFGKATRCASFPVVILIPSIRNWTQRGGRGVKISSLRNIPNSVNSVPLR